MLIGLLCTSAVFFKLEDLQKTIPLITLYIKQKVSESSIMMFISLQERKKVFKIMMPIMAKIRMCQYEKHCLNTL